MKLIIDIPEKEYHNIQTMSKDGIGMLLYDWIANGKPLEDELQEIRQEIEQTVSRYTIAREHGSMGQVEWSDRLIKESDVLEIIDTHIKEYTNEKCN